jgi:hypothetical protein
VKPQLLHLPMISQQISLVVVAIRRSSNERWLSYLLLSYPRITFGLLHFIQWVISRAKCSRPSLSMW